MFDNLDGGDKIEGRAKLCGKIGVVEIHLYKGSLHTQVVFQVGGDDAKSRASQPESQNAAPGAEFERVAAFRQVAMGNVEHEIVDPGKRANKFGGAGLALGCHIAVSPGTGHGVGSLREAVPVMAAARE